MWGFHCLGMNRDFIEAAHEQRIDEPRGAAADIDDCRLRSVGKSLDQAERRLRISLRPADLLLAFLAIDVLPVRLAIGFGHIVRRESGWFVTARNPS